MALEHESGKEDDRARWTSAAAVGVCVLAFFYSVWPLRDAYRSWNDFRFVYVGGMNWLQGISPYDFEAWVANWRRVPHDFLVGPPTQPFVYPPHWAIIAIPFAALPWSVATRIWDVVSIAAFASTVALCGSMLGRAWWSKPGVWFFVAAATISGVVRYAIWESQMSLLPTLGVVGSIWAWRRGSQRALAVFVFIAALKPQIAVLPLLFLLLNGGHVGLIGGGVLIAATAIAALAPVGLAAFPAQYHRCLQLHLAAGFNQRDNFTNLAVIWSHVRSGATWFWVSPWLAMMTVGTLTVLRRRRGTALAEMLSDPLWLLALLAAAEAALVPLHQYDLVVYTPIFFLAYRLRPMWLSWSLIAMVEIADRPHLLGGAHTPALVEPWLTMSVAVFCLAALLINRDGALGRRPLLAQTSR